MKKILVKLLDGFIISFLLWITFSTVNICQYNNYEDQSQYIWKYNAYNILIVEEAVNYIEGE